MKSFISFILVSALLIVQSQAREGMWLPFLIKQLNESEMQRMGMKISAEDIYSVNQSSLKDAVVIFGGGCTGELISSQGLLLTNHHCGYGQIQSHSSLENDYLTDGFWAMNKEQELPNSGLTATFIKRMEDVSSEVLEGIYASTPQAERRSKIQERIKKIVARSTENTNLKAEVKAFFMGNQYILIVSEVYKDVRLVGAPPSSIGKFGFDTDNWVWPRHTGDFALFRIYADKDNKPAEFNKENVPYKPIHHFPVSVQGYKPGDFTMVYGFPGSTQQYLPEVAVRYVMQIANPAKIKMRDTSLEIIGRAMRNDKKINIQYAAKQSRIANAWKKWIGQNKGLENKGALEIKRDLENEFQQKVEANAEWKANYGSLLSEYNQVHKNYEKPHFAREMLIEIFYYGPEFLRFAYNFEALQNAKTESEFNTVLEKLKASKAGFFKDYNMQVDKELFNAMVPLYLEYVDETLRPEYWTTYLNKRKNGDWLYQKSAFVNEARFDALVNKIKFKKTSALAKDPGFLFAKHLMDTYNTKAKGEYENLQPQIAELERKYMEALMLVMPDYKKYYPDANFSLRVTYGNVGGYKPMDAVEYQYFTTTEGILEKYDSLSYEFNVPKKLVELIKTKDYGNYANADGTMPVCFLAANHTTGGNSGSPALNANGHLIGLNFDRTWESTMSDIMYDPNICRNIMVDARYILFIVDKFAGAKHLVDEMTLVR